MQYIPRSVAIAITIVAAASVAALATTLTPPSASVAPMPRSSSEPPRQLAPVHTAGGAIVSFSASRLTFRTATEERAVLVTNQTVIVKLERASERALRRVAGAPADLKPGAAVTATTDGNFLEPAALTASRLEVVPAGTPFLPIQ